MVVNTLRPFASTVERICNAARELSEVTRMPISGLVANTNLGPLTTSEMVLSGCSTVCAAAAALNVPVRAVVVPEFLRDELSSDSFNDSCGCPLTSAGDELPILWLHRRVLLPWERAD